MATFDPFDGRITVTLTAFAFPWHGAATIVVAGLPVGTVTCCLMPNATGFAPLGTLSAEETTPPGPSTNADDGT
ncbi:MAG: hypothetical protein QOC95_2566, partial [Thermoleophilaceae bacterium]|nr:hypothetical protein [Thermoleophilaceae bacterium]